MMDNGSRSPGMPHRAAWIVLLVVLVGALLVVLRILVVFFSVILLATVTAGLVQPIYRRAVVLFKGHRRTAASLLCALLLTALLVPISVTVQVVSEEALGFYDMTTTQLTKRAIVDQVEKRQAELDQLNRYLDVVGLRLTVEDVQEVFTSMGVRLGGFFYYQGVDLAKGLVRLVLGFGFWVLVLYYLLVDGDRLREWFRETVPLPGHEQDVLSHRFIDMSFSLVIGNGLAGLIQGIAGGLVFALCGVPGPVLWGVVMAILALIPVVGISLVYLPVGGILLLTGQTTEALLMVIPLAVVATVVEYWLKPVLVGRRAEMHTLLVFLSLLGGLQAFGVVGLLLGPLMMTAFLTLAGIFKDHYRPYMSLGKAGRRATDQIAEAMPEGETSAAEGGGG